MPTLTSNKAKQDFVLKLKDRAKKLGFDEFGIVSANKADDRIKHLEYALDKGFHAGMDWLAREPTKRANPKQLWGEVKSIIILGLNYAPKKNPLYLLEQKDKAYISTYARNIDYHDIIKGRLKEIASLFSKIDGAKLKVFVDTAPVMEKPLAQSAGIGWQGKNSLLISRKFGAYLFLGAIYTNIELPANDKESEKCGSCTKCLDICPTNAFPSPFKLDASKCLAYYNNEHKGHIPLYYRPLMGNRIFGCDDCIAICPWNKFAKQAKEIKLQERADLLEPQIVELLSLDDKNFRKKFARSPIKRLGHARFMRNVLICAGNSGNTKLAADVKKYLEHCEPLIRAMAVWAYSRLAKRGEFLAAKKYYLPKENDEQIKKEWQING